MQKELNRFTRFTTDNGLLAFALFSVGVKMVEIWNCYTAELLESLGEPSVKTARERGKRGKVRFVFERSEQLESYLKVWSAAQQRAKDGSVMEMKNATPLEFIEMAAHLLLLRSGFMDLWKKVPARFVKSYGDADILPGNDGSKIVMHPGFIMATENLSPEKRKAIGL